MLMIQNIPVTLDMVVKTLLKISFAY
jgi:hypothetical protein